QVVGANADRARAEEAPGGIDFDPELLDLQTQGRGMDFTPMDPASLENLTIDGFTPIILKITPVTSIPLLLGGEKKKSPSAV
ncbi:MAG: hypothetical protein NUV91_06950, partial [Candidatus Omnitrophica bacterium]|nr:hypothetical protein [Candidatus Omnitrophota bacterium]